MVQNVNPTFVKTPNNGATQITTGTGSGNPVTAYQGGSNGSKINALIACGFTSAAFDVNWGTSSGGGTFYTYGTVTVPSGAGTSGAVPSANLMNTTNNPGLPLDSDGNPYIFLASSAWFLWCAAGALSSAWSSGNQIRIVVPSAGDF